MREEVIAIGHEEGDTCNRDGCKGIMKLGEGKGDGCYCHIHTPCSYCMGKVPTCDICGEEEES